ncbi:MAG: dihydrolipoamide acetyltransferase family protein [Terriglobales bacterium]|jgi:pyruvate dehydrogenase E2 component (dihydrolipoamide acetyltransferase)
MAIPIEMPKLGNTVEECTVSRWMKHKGDPVASGDLVVEIETDKATFEINAPVAGTILETFFEEGALVPVFTNLFVIGNPGESGDAFRPHAAQAGAAPAQETNASSKPAAPPAQSQAAEIAAASSAALSPRARRFAAEHDFDAARVVGSGPGGRVLESDVRKAYHPSPPLSLDAKERVPTGLAAPAEGSGAGGMILSADLTEDLTEPSAEISSLREKIARRMRESLSNTAQYTLNSSADASGLLNLRARVKAATRLPDININDLIAFCAIKALLQAPDVNAEFIEGRIHKHSEVHLGFACDTLRGLIVPVVRNANRLTIAELALKMKELTAQAVKGSIALDDLSGATFTISNLGSLGIESFTPLLNPPQVAILGIGAIQVKAIRREGKVEFIDAIGLSLTCDHQIVDGAPGARFLKVVIEKIENVESLCTI